MDQALATLIGLLAGLHTCTWGMYKDAPHEGFSWPKYFRSAVVGAVLGTVTHHFTKWPLADEPGRSCAVLDGTACSLERELDVVLVVRARPLDRVVRSEYGAVCALRRNVPLVLAGANGSLYEERIRNLLGPAQ